MLCGPLDMPNLTLGIASTAELLHWAPTPSDIVGQLLLLTAIVTAAAAADAVNNNCLHKRMHLSRSRVNMLICRGYVMV
jgi:hypothetical protein